MSQPGAPSYDASSPPSSHAESRACQPPLSTAPEPALTAIVQMAAALADTPHAYVVLTNADEARVAAAVGDESPSSSHDHCVHCRQVLRTRRPVVVMNEAKRGTVGAESGRAANRGFYAGWPLVTSRGEPLGTLVVRDVRPRRLKPVQRAALERLAGVTARLINERRQVEEALHQHAELTDVTFSAIGDAVITTDANERVAFLNPIAEHLTGVSRAQATGRTLAHVFRSVDPATARPLRPPVHDALVDNQRHGPQAAVLIGRHGRRTDIDVFAAPIHDHQGLTVGAVLVFRDTTGSRATALHLARLAQHDFLTGLPNRVLLLDRVAQAVAQARRSARQVALLFIDLDKFKHVNDSLGHEAGDSLLRDVATRLRSCVRASDTVCRQGGDEFVVLLPEAPSVDDVAFIAEKLLDACRQRFSIDGHDVYVGASIGVSLFPTDGQDVDALTRNADAAMYHAKALGRNNFQFYTPDMNARARDRLVLENNLRRALGSHEFVLHYQPIQHLETGAVVGCEALLRWNDPARGLVAPADFLPLIEDSSLMVPVSQWALHEACRQRREWQIAGLPPIPVSVNLSGAQFRRKDFKDSIAEALTRSQLDPTLLELELTEGIVMGDADAAVGVLRSLKDMGVRLSIDDFGTGYSSLSHLRRFPIDTLKIDQSFVRDLTTDHDDAAAITSAIISMAKSLRHNVVAEGVEHTRQVEFLRERGCDAMQGYYYRPPLSASELRRLFAV